METKFQTSFIPKKPILSETTPKAHHSVSIFVLISVLVFIISIAGAGFVIFWKSVLLKTQSDYQQTLTKNESQFDLTTINTLRRVNAKIDIAKQLLGKHIAVTEIFGIMGALTAQNSEFTSLSITVPASTPPNTGSATNNLNNSSSVAANVPTSSGTTNSVSSNSRGTLSTLAQISMSGVAVDFSSVAFQSDVLGASSKYGRNIVLTNPVISGLSLNTNSNVAFTLTASIDPSNLSYQKFLNDSLGSGSSNSSGSSNPN